MNTPEKTTVFCAPGAPDGKTGKKLPYPPNIGRRKLFRDDNEVEFQHCVPGAPRKLRRLN